MTMIVVYDKLRPHIYVQNPPKTNQISQELSFTKH